MAAPLVGLLAPACQEHAGASVTNMAVPERKNLVLVKRFELKKDRSGGVLVLPAILLRAEEQNIDPNEQIRSQTTTTTKMMDPGVGYQLLTVNQKNTRREELSRQPRSFIQYTTLLFKTINQAY